MTQRAAAQTGRLSTFVRRCTLECRLNCHCAEEAVHNERCSGCASDGQTGSRLSCDPYATPVACRCGGALCLIARRLMNTAGDLAAWHIGTTTRFHLEGQAIELAGTIPNRIFAGDVRSWLAEGYRSIRDSVLSRTRRVVETCLHRDPMTRRWC